MFNGRCNMDNARSRVRGGFLLEALVALLIFSFGLLAMAGLHARAVRHFNEAQYRANAADIVHGAIAAMRAIDVTTLAARFDQSTRADGWSALLDPADDEVHGASPGVAGRQDHGDGSMDLSRASGSSCLLAAYVPGR